MEYVVGAGAALWAVLLLVPWRPWSSREHLECSGSDSESTLRDVTVLIPARNEAGSIRRTLAALVAQGAELRVVLVDDQSSDDTVNLARSTIPSGLTVIEGAPLPHGWTGKLWALEQGLRFVSTELVLLLDADIELSPGMVDALRKKLNAGHFDLVSIMAWLRMETFWEKLLAPAFIYFFKLVYPFHLGNSKDSKLGVAAGGCMLARVQALRNVGAFHCIRGAIIDDCSLAALLKTSGANLWIGLSHHVRSHRSYARLADFWEMIARTAYTQLRYSFWWLAGTTILMIGMFLAPIAGLFSDSLFTRLAALVALSAMIAAYLPTLRYYRRSTLWAAAMPVIGALYLGMTWTSAIRYWRGRRSEWKGRIYGRSS